MDYIKEYPDLRWTHPTTVLCCGSSFSGKSTWVQNLARDLKYVMKNPPDRIVYLFKNWQNSFDQLKEDVENIEFYKSFDDPMLDLEGLQNVFLILDDVAPDAPPGFLKSWHTVKSHHYNSSICTLLHNVFDSSVADLRTISLNTQIFNFMKSPRAYDSLVYFSRQVFGPSYKCLLSVYEEYVLQNMWSYITVDVSPFCPPELKIRSKIFSFEAPMITP